MKPPTAQTADKGHAPLILHAFPTFAVGGAQVRFAAIANHFGGGFRHTVVSLDGDLACRERLRPDLDVTFPPMASTKHAMLSNTLQFRRLLRDRKPDMLVTYNWGAIEFALANVVPLTRHLHVVDGFGRRNAAPRSRAAFGCAGSFSAARPSCCPSRNLVRIARDIWKLPSKVIRYVPNGIDLARFGTDGDQRGGVEPVIGTVAALREERI